MKNIGIFGTFFFNFEEILNNIQKTTDNEIYFFTDSPHGLSIINNSKIHCEYITDQKNTNLIYTYKDLETLLRVDQDRFEEFSIKSPRAYELKVLADNIIDSLKRWIKENNIDLLVCEGRHNFFNNVIIDYLKKNNINYFSFRSGRLPNTTLIEKNELKLCKNFNQKSQIKNIIPSYMEKTHPNHRSIFLKILNFKGTSLYRDIMAFFDFIKSRNFYNNNPSTVPRWQLIFKMRYIYLSSKIKSIIFYNFFKKKSPENVSFYIYPEHFRPEASTTRDDFFLKDDILNILNIIPQLKDNEYLVFRFHPSYFTKRPIKQLYFLKKISEGGKLFFSLPNENINKLIARSKGVISVSSTVIIDSLRNKKPAIVLGKPEFYDELKNYGLFYQNIEKLDFVIFDENKKTTDFSNEELENRLYELYFPYSVESGKWILEILDA